MRKRFLLAVFLLAASLFSVLAQNNSYEMDDECYELYLEADKLAGKPGFDEANSALLQSAVLKQDIRAQVFFYVERLKDCCRRPLDLAENAGKAETLEAAIRRGEEVMAMHEELKRVSLELDFIQYYYYSYQLAKNYYYNNGMQLRALELVQEMRQDAVERGDAYGRWTGAREMSTIYQAMRDQLTARQYMADMLREYAQSGDPLIRRQSLTTLYLDYANTFSPGDDSSKYYIFKAMEDIATPQDSLRCENALAKMYAVECNRSQYTYYRDRVLSSPFFSILSRSTGALFQSIDYLFDGTGDQHGNEMGLQPVSNIRVLSTVARRLGNKDLAAELTDIILKDTEQFFSKMNSVHMAEMEAQFGNTRLSADLAEKTRQADRMKTVAIGLTALVLLALLVFLLFTVRNLKRQEKKDEKVIAELKEANEKVRLANDAKTRFVQNMSHEVRTPLNAIVGFSQLLSLPDGSFPPEEKEEFSSHIVNNTKMLTMLLDDILNASSMDSGNYRITYEEGECGFMCQAAISSAEHRLQPGVTMRYVPAFEGPYTFRTDPRRVQQILINLLTNACKHTPKGEIRLGCSLEENPGEITFSVEDTGPGVPAEQAEKIFDRFTKLNDFVQGTGLGLSICREIAGKMGGRVFLDTAYSGGARFVFVLPAAPGSPE
ncbi:MAG: HAMP domain-containing histidine kinase [Bacteroidales bacterium]|nr:HAMP domain-containing histidine kinase [Bacteroidales bacterium]